MSLEKAVICFTGLPAVVREENAQKILAMRGKVSRELNRSVTHLVAEFCDPLSEKYNARTLKLPVMGLNWIDAAWSCHNANDSTPINMTSDAMVEKYRLPLFSNCVITVSGFDADDRLHIGRLLEMHGGKFDDQMSRRTCTHLIASSNSGTKYRKAFEWQSVEIVDVRWLRKCIETGYRLPEAKFRIKRSSGGGSKTVTGSAFAQGAAVARPTATKQP